MTVIPAGFAQSNLLFGGVALPNGAEATMGHDISLYPGDPADLAAEIIALWDTNFSPQVTSELLLTGCLVKFGPDATGPSALVGANFAGELPGTGTAANTSYLVHKTTPLGGRAGRGRWFHPGCTEPDVSAAGVIATPRFNAMQDACNAFLSDLLAAQASAVLLHSVGSPISVPTTISQLRLDSRVATQRRRLRR